VIAYQDVALPSVYFDGLWEKYVCIMDNSLLTIHSLIFEDNLKAQLLAYMQSALLFAESGIDSNIISWNRCGVAREVILISLKG